MLSAQPVKGRNREENSSFFMDIACIVQQCITQTAASHEEHISGVWGLGTTQCCPQHRKERVQRQAAIYREAVDTYLAASWLCVGLGVASNAGQLL